MKNSVFRFCFSRLYALSYLFLALFYISCNPAKQERLFTVGFSQCTASDDWRKMMLEEMKRELPFHENIRFEYLDADGSSEKQISQIKEFLRLPVDLLIVSPNEVKPLSPIIQRVFDSGIPVVVVDRRTDSKKYSAFIGASNFEVGQNAGRYAASILKGRGNVIEVTGIPDASPVIDRHNGFKEIIDRFPEIKYRKRFDNYISIDSANSVESYLKTHGNIDLIYAQNDFMALDVFKICKKLGFDKRIKIIGVDGLPLKGDGLDMVEKKYISATVLYPTGGQEAILTAANILEGKPYRKENQLYTTVIDSTNIRIIKLQDEKVMAQQKDIDRSEKKIEDQAIITRNQTKIIYTISLSLAFALIMGAILFYYLKENRKINAKLALQNEEILNQRNQLIELGKTVQEATEAKIHFFTNISHEFRTPLTLIMAPLEELFDNPKIHFSAKQSLALIQKNAVRLLKLINQLIDFRKIESYKMKLNASNNDLVVFTNEIIENFRTLAKKRHIDINLFTRERTIMVWFDISMIDKVMFNLLSNAFKFSNDHGFIHITLDVNSLENYVKLKVEDNGIGMTKNVAEHAFELFYQGDITNQQGSGLGLALSKELIQLHHGKISVTSKLGKGTIFEIILPLGTDHLKKDEMLLEKPSEEVLYQEERLFDMELQSGPDENEGDQTILSKPERSILIVEDNPDLRNFLCNKLSKTYEIFVSDNGGSALQQAFDNIPDLIISDVVIPGKDGIAITHNLKNDFRTSHIPIVLLTSRNAIEGKIEGMRSMADAYVVKPFNFKFLEETIKSLLRNREILKEHYTSELHVEVKTQNPSKLDRKFINEFNSIIENNIGNENFSVDELFHTMGISRVQLYRKVKALLGYNINDYILNVRLQKSKHYLSEDKLTISEIAYKVGFSSAAYFSTVFKSKFAITPSEYRDKKTDL